MLHIIFLQNIFFLGYNPDMIHILCLNPTIDRMYYIDSFLPGFQYHGNQGESYPGGKGMNILRVLSEFVSPLSFYAFTAGGNGEIIKREAERLKALSVFIDVQGETRTTINIMDKKIAPGTYNLSGSKSIDSEEVMKGRTRGPKQEKTGACSFVFDNNELQICEKK